MKMNLDFIYPIGSIYLTVSDMNPAVLFGGTWEKMSGGYLYACTNIISNSDYTGLGTQPHKLTINEMPSHSHNFARTSGSNMSYVIATSGARSGDYNDSIGGSTGGNQAHSHDIAYVGVWCWKRTK